MGLLAQENSPRKLIIGNYSRADLEYAFRKVDADICRENFAHFIRTFWDIIVQDELQWSNHLDILTDHCMSVGRQVGNRKHREYDTLVNIPPGTTKSLTISVFFPLWCWINWPWMRFITCSHAQSLSDDHANLCKMILKSDRFKVYFPEIDVLRGKDSLRDFRLELIQNGELKMGGGRLSTSVEGGGIGMHAHIIIVDDPVDPKKSYSDVERTSVNEWLSKTLSQRRALKDITHYFMVMQRVHEGDPSGDMLRRMGSMFRLPDGKVGDNPKGRVYHICLPGEIRNYKEYVSPPSLLDIYSEDGLLDPVRMGWDELEDMEARLGQYGYAGQVGQKPTPPGGGMFNPEHILILDNPLPDHIQIIRTVRYWDKAGTDKKDAGPQTSWTCGIKMALAKIDDKICWIILDEIRGQWAAHEREQIISNAMKGDGKHVKVWIEQEGGSGGKESAESTIDSNPKYSVRADKVSGDKVTRADPFSVQVNRGNVYMMRGEFNYGYKQEMENFPLAITKDRIDASSGAFSRLTEDQEITTISSSLIY